MKTDDKNNQRRRNTDIFDFFGAEDDLSNIFDAMDRMIRDVLDAMSYGDLNPGKSFIRGMFVHNDPILGPRIKEFGNFSQIDLDGKSTSFGEQKPLVDMIEYDGIISITTEVPGMEKDDIYVKIKNKKLQIDIDNLEAKYHKVIELPCDVKPKSLRVSLKNNVLDIEIKKNDSNKNE
jgi:HSP20 family molecular chaperone IbpA